MWYLCIHDREAFTFLFVVFFSPFTATFFTRPLGASFWTENVRLCCPLGLALLFQLVSGTKLWSRCNTSNGKKIPTLNSAVQLLDLASHASAYKLDCPTVIRDGDEDKKTKEL